ncbi:putative phosphatase regulatory subunit-domain-containing protein [Amylocystis lapponica]|nr:putative phosphatase regulatory subunit-domain-containing protein [Amylocystis lapponica]
MTSVVALRPSILMDNTFSRHSNSAGAPLPHIPRRTSATRAQALTTLQTMFDSPYPSTSTSPPLQVLPVVVHPPTPPRDPLQHRASGSSSSGSSDSHAPMLVPKARRTRRAKSPLPSMRPPEHSTPTPSLFRAQGSQERIAWPVQDDVEQSSGQETPRPRLRPPRLNLTTLSVPEPSTVVRPERAGRAASAAHAADAALVRKKSGEPLKSSLKGRRPVVRGDLSVVTGGVAPTASKSEPSTPTHIKSVHFDAQLEHVKLFLAEQKPLAVSRDGSPTTDTSGTESDFPAFIYGPDARRTLVMQVVNMPVGARTDVDVAVEELSLAADGTSVNGRVRVRNVAFEKWVAVRFTFDWWQTTSEVTAKYFDSPSIVFDRFTFTIRLNDILARIEDKTLFLAVRYTAAAQEMWDNNAGANYQVKFTKAKPTPSPMKENTEDAGIADLKSMLEQVAIGQETVGRVMTQQSRKSPSRDQFNIRSNAPLSSRYDFSVSLKSPWKGNTPSPPLHSRNSTYPNGLSAIPKRTYSTPVSRSASVFVGPQAATRGSPRILDEDSQPIPVYADFELGESPMPLMSRRRGRNHQRGYFEIGFPLVGSPGTRRTPPGSPARLTSFDTRRHSPSHVVSPGLRIEPLATPWRVELGGSEESTPSITSTTESSRSSSPSGSRAESPVVFGLERATSPQSPGDDYNSFLNKFCFYTGSDSLLDVHTDVLQRSHSASSVEEFLSSPVLNYQLSPMNTPTRSSSFDDVAAVSGASTPTARSIFAAEASTPVPMAH